MNDSRVDSDQENFHIANDSAMRIPLSYVTQLEPLKCVLYPHSGASYSREHQDGVWSPGRLWRR
jgi:hypothetical protein